MERFEVAGKNAQHRCGRIVSGIKGLAGWHETRGRIGRQRWRGIDRAYGFDPRKLPEFACCLFKVVVLGRGRTVLIAAEGVPDQKHLVGVKSPGFLRKVQESLHDQACGR